MAALNNSELWLSDSDGTEIDVDEVTDTSDPTYIDLGLSQSGQSGDYHVRNKTGQKQRPQVSGFGGGRSKKWPAFRVGCTAKAIIHGTLDPTDTTPATLLVYDFTFFSFRSRRIKSANICFEFLGVDGTTANAPLVKQMAPFAKNTMMPSTEKKTRTVTSEGGVSSGVGAVVDGKLSLENSVEKETTHAATIIGDCPTDDWGNTFAAHWSLHENDSQKKGIATQLRTAILLVRDNHEDEFRCVPNVEVQLDFKSWLGTIGSSRTPDDPVIFDPEYEPFNVLEGAPIIDRWNLAAVDLNKLWDCTFETAFPDAVKTASN